MADNEGSATSRTVVVEAVSLERMRKRAQVHTARPGATVYTIECDEGQHIGGDDTAPTPLAYFTAGVAF